MTLHEDLELCVPTHGPIRTYLEWAVKTTDAEQLFHLGSILPIIANELVKGGFTIDEERRLVPSLWSFLIGVPASSKSTAQTRAQDFYKRFLATAAGHEVTSPFILAEGSIPGLFEALASRYDPEMHMSCGVIIRDEAARLLDNKDTSIGDMLINVIDGVEVERHLRGYKEANRAKPGSVREKLLSPAFSGCLATTFARLREVTKASMIEGGLYSRFLWFVGQPCLPDPRLRIDLHVEESRRVLDSWLDLGKWILGMQALGDERVVTLTEEAYAYLESTLFQTFRDAARFDSRMNATRKRGLTQAVIVAGIYALTQERTRIELIDMEQAVNLILLCTKGLEELEGTLCVPETVSDAERVHTFIVQCEAEGCSRSQLYALKLDKRALETALEMLVDQGAIVEQIVPRGSGGGSGRPARVYRATRKTRQDEPPKRVSARATHLRLVTLDPVPTPTADAAGAETDAKKVDDDEQPE